MIAALVATALSLASYHGPALKGAVPGTHAFALTVHAAPHARVRIRAEDVPAGYLASFCTPRICAPFAVPLTLDATGSATIELQIIRNDPHAVPPRTVRVASDDGARAQIAYARGSR